MSDVDEQGGTTGSPQHQTGSIPDTRFPAESLSQPRIGVEVDPQQKTGKESPQGERTASQDQQDTLTAIRKGERIALIIAAIVALATVSQVAITIINNISTSAQTDKMIFAANTNAGAARAFAMRAESINKGVGDAVEKLDAQVKASHDFATQTAGRFVKEQRPYIWHDTLQGDESNPLFIGERVYYTNCGKSPALRFSSTGHIFCSTDALTEAYRYLDRLERERTWDSVNTIEPPSISQGVPTPNRGYDTFVTDPLSSQQWLLCAGPNPALPRITVGAWEYYDLAGNRYYGEFL